jgi:hypothetical protein
MRTPMPAVILYYEERCFGNCAFIVRRYDGSGKIGQLVWGVPSEPTSEPPFFPVYHQKTEFSSKGNDALIETAFGKGRVVAHADTRNTALAKAETLARNTAGLDAIDRTRAGLDLKNPEPMYRLWYLPTILVDQKKGNVTS